MVKPANIVLTLVGTAVAGGVGLSGYNQTTREVRAGTRQYTSSLPTAEQAIPDREYDNDSYIPGVGYYHAPAHAWYGYRFNYFDGARGYFHGGIWTPAPATAGILRSRPTPDALARARADYRRTHTVSSGNGSLGYYSSGHVGSYSPSGTNGFDHGTSSFHSSDAAGGTHTSGGTTRGGFGSTGAHSSASGS